VTDRHKPHIPRFLRLPGNLVHYESGLHDQIIVVLETECVVGCVRKRHITEEDVFDLMFKLAGNWGNEISILCLWNDYPGIFTSARVMCRILKIRT